MASRIYFSIAILCILTACQGGDNAPQTVWENTENILNFDVNYEFGVLDPTCIDASGSTSIFPLLYSYLFLPDQSDKLMPDLAVHWDYDKNRLAWKIRLRTNARFHNGESVTAWDVAHSIRLHTNRYANVGELINTIQVPSDETIIIQLKRDDPFFLKKIWDFEIIPDSKRHQKVNYYSHPIGSGPFMFKKRDGRSMVLLEANADYYNGRSALDGIRFHFISDKEKSWARLITGETDVTGEIIPQDYKMIRQLQNRFYFNEYIQEYYTILLYNTYHPLFRNQEIRKALTMAIDRAYIVDSILDGYGRIASGPMGIGSPYHDPQVTPLPYDPIAALKILGKDGWSFDPDGQRLVKSGQTFSFELLLTELNELDLKISRFISLCLSEIGIQVSIKTAPYALIKQKYYRNTGFEAVLVELRGVYQDTASIMDQWTTSSNGRSMAGGFESADVTSMVQTALHTQQMSLKKALLQKVDEKIAALQPGTFLFHKTALDVMSKRFIMKKTPFVITLRGIYRLQFANLRIGYNYPPK